MADTLFDSSAEPPLTIDSVENAQWADTADIVIIGYGGAGAVAALQARELGLDALVLDRFSGGGATQFSGGIIYSGGTRFQREAGVEDSAENMFNYLVQEESAVSTQTLRRFCDGSSADIDWLSDHGLQFGGPAYPEKTVYPPEPYYLYYSGNEKVKSYTASATPAQRGHRTAGKGMTGYAYFAGLRQAVEKAAIRTRLHSPVRRLVVDPSGAVVGVEILDIPADRWAEHDKIYGKVKPMSPFSGKGNEKAVRSCEAFERQFTTRRLIRARGGVVLATGGFINNLDTLRRQNPPYADAYGALMRIGSMGCDGSGIDLGQSVGGATQLMDRIFTGRAITPPNAFMGGILVDHAGRRFINEDAYSGFIGGAIGELPQGGKSWLIMDRPTYKKALHDCMFPGKGLYMYTLPALMNILLGGTRKARSLDALAAKCGLDSAVLKASVDDNNAAANGGSDPQGKSAKMVAPIAQGPFYAVNMSLANKFVMTMCFSLGGLTVDENSGAVTRDDGTAVPGLYAAGRAAIGLCSKGYLSGMSIADTVFSGRRAAHAVSARVNGAGV